VDVLAISNEEAIWRLTVALLLGAIIGIEREMTQKSAGMRTHMLVCMGSAIFTLISTADLWSHSLPTTPLPPGVHLNISQDPGRISAQIVTGIGFIGGGALLKYGTNVRGVTTAASLWLMAAVGMLVGIGALQLAFVATVMAFVVLFSLGRVERIIFGKHLKEHSRMQLLISVEKAQADGVVLWLEEFFRRDILEMARTAAMVTEGEEEAVQLTYLMNIHGRNTDWIQWRHKLDELPGVIDTSIHLLA
jgi:putative Mg2+ transporter-C (MgtC) family protein